jgi:hypothetical protein
MRQITKALVFVPAAALLAACGGRAADKADAAADALSSDLALAATAQPYGQQQFVSPQELGYAGQYPQPNGQYPQAYGQYPQGYYPYPYPPAQAPTPAVYRYPAPAPQRASTSGRIYRAPAPAPVKRNTTRDALIGATAGVIAGSVIGRDVKGAIVGAAAGGLLGAVVGHTIDKSP